MPALFLQSLYARRAQSSYQNPQPTSYFHNVLVVNDWLSCSCAGGILCIQDWIRSHRPQTFSERFRNRALFCSLSVPQDTLGTSKTSIPPLLNYSIPGSSTLYHVSTRSHITLQMTLKRDTAKKEVAAARAAAGSAEAAARSPSTIPGASDPWDAS